MAYWVHECGNKNNALWRFYMCDYISDLNKLPTANKDGEPQPNDSVSQKKCAPGSQCLCQEDGSAWILGKETDKWIKRNNSFSGGSGSGVIGEENIEPIPSFSIESLFS